MRERGSKSRGSREGGFHGSKLKAKDEGGWLGVGVLARSGEVG